MKEFDEDYLEHLKSIISDDKHEEARTELASLHPADIAELYRNLELEQAEYLFKLLDEEKAADVLMELDEDDRLKLLNAMPAEEIAKQIDHLDTDDAVDLIQQRGHRAKRGFFLAHSAGKHYRQATVVATLCG